MSAYVFVIGRGERAEGQEPIAATMTLRQAKRAVFELFDVEVAKAGASCWVANIGGCDEVWIHKLLLEGAS